MFIPFLAASIVAAAFTHMSAQSVQIAILSSTVNALVLLLIAAAVYMVRAYRYEPAQDPPPYGNVRGFFHAQKLPPKGIYVSPNHRRHIRLFHVAQAWSIGSMGWCPSTGPQAFHRTHRATGWPAGLAAHQEVTH
jgi:hypothetical protein